MNLDALKAEFDASIAHMTEDDLVALMERAGCVFEDPWLDAELDQVCLFDETNYADANELALAA